MFKKECKNEVSIENQSINETTTENSPLVAKGKKGSISPFFALKAQDEYQLTEDEQEEQIKRLSKVLHRLGM